MQVSIIAIGDELLIGQVVDTNSGMISREINLDGWSVRSVRVVADDADEINGQSSKRLTRPMWCLPPEASALRKTT